NVQGLLRDEFKPYFSYIIRALRSPSLCPRRNETWQDHSRRLRRNEESRRFRAEYSVEFALLNAADFGVPQIRRRVFIVGVRSPRATVSFPQPTHSRAALVRSQLVGVYWQERGLKRPSGLEKEFPRIPNADVLLPWRTVRDAIGSLPSPAPSEDSATENGHL